MSQPRYLQRETDLVARIRTGDRGAFEEMFRAYYSQLCVFTEGYIGSADATRELVQDVFVRIWENRQDWLVRGSLKSYLYTAARNRALNQLRDERTRRRLAEETHWPGAPPGMGEVAASADERVEAGEFEAAIYEAVTKLPEHYRRIFELRSHHGLTHAEIARILNLPVKTVETRSSRALRRLRILLAAYFEA